MDAPPSPPQEEPEEDPLDLLTPEQLQQYVDQLKKESLLDRTKTSEGCKVVMEFINGRMVEDPLIIGIDSKINPYIEKKDCTIL